MSILFTFVTNLSYIVFLIKSLFTTLISLLKLTGAVFNLSKPISFSHSSKLEILIPIKFFKSVFVE